MIIGFRHKGLERLYRSGISSGIPTQSHQQG